MDDPGRTAYEARFADEKPRDIDPWDALPPEVKAIWARVEVACQAAVARADASDHEIRTALRRTRLRERVVLGDGVTPERVVKLALDVVDLAYRAHGENGRASLLAVQVDWIMQRWADAEERAAAAETRAEEEETGAARLLIAFHDAIRRPLGMTPDSGAEFYDQRMADEAEARRAQGGGDA